MVDIDSEICLVADDCVCYCQIHSIEDTVKLQRDINHLGRWARHENPAHQMQYDAVDREMDQKGHCNLHIRENSLGKCNL